MGAIVFPVSSCPGVKPQEGSGRLINCRAVKTEQGSRSPIRWEGQPGLREQFSTATYSHCRGAVLIGSTLLIVLDTRVLSVTLSGTSYTVTDLGALAGTDLVTIGRNNATPPNIAVVCDAGTFNLFIGSAPTSFADGDLPAANSVTGMNGYLIFTTGAGEIWSTDLNSVSVQSDAFTSAQMNPDGLLRGAVINDEFYAFGTNSIEVYDEVGTTPFPLKYKGVTIQPGLIGTHAVAGFEDGWKNQFHYVGSDFNVYRLDGYNPVPIGNEAVGRAIATASDKSAIEASVYMDGQHAFFVITSPGEWTWEYNKTTGNWNERSSNARADWRGRRSVRAFDRWIIGDDTTGKFAEIDSTYSKEYGDPIIFHLESGDNAVFPQPIAIPSAFFDFTAAVGTSSGADPIETNPKVMISWSLNGGYTFGNEITRALGAEGEAGTQVRVNRIGTTKGGKGARFRLRISDPVRRGFLGGQMPDAGALSP